MGQFIHSLFFLLDAQSLTKASFIWLGCPRCGQNAKRHCDLPWIEAIISANAAALRCAALPERLCACLHSANGYVGRFCEVDCFSLTQIVAAVNHFGRLCQMLQRIHPIPSIPYCHIFAAEMCNSNAIIRSAMVHENLTELGRASG